MKQTKIDYDHFRWYQKLMRDVARIEAENLSKADMILYIALLRMPDFDTYGYKEAISEAIRKPLTQAEKDEIVGSYNNGKWWTDNPGLDDL
jgi:ribosome biogenesis GTPase A